MQTTPTPTISMKQAYAAFSQGAADILNGDLEPKHARKTQSSIKRATDSASAKQLPLQTREQLLSRYGFQFNTARACFARTIGPSSKHLLLVFKGEADNLTGVLEFDGKLAGEWPLTSLAGSIEESTKELSALMSAATCVAAGQIRPTAQQADKEAAEASHIVGSMRSWIVGAPYGVEEPDL